MRFLQKVAKSVKGWPMLYDFYKRWPSQYFSRKVANVVRISQKVAKSVKRWPMLFDFAKGGQAYKAAFV